MASIRLTGVRNRFVCPGEFYVEDGDICAVVGPSGAGKTSMLRIIAGLDRHEGKVLIDDQEIQDKEPHRRAIGFVSQDLHLFPHLTLEGNIYLGMKRSKMSRPVKLNHIRKLTDLLRISHLAGRKPDTFSGGEKQRTALARVLASSPRVLLLDEPFSKLDFRTARYLRKEFSNLRKQLKLTTIIVTHNMKEAAEMADTIWVMQNGSITSSVTALKTLCNGQCSPDSFLETPNVLPCEFCENCNNGLVKVKWEGGTLMIPDEGKTFSRFMVGRREIDISTGVPKGPPVNRFTGIIGDIGINNDWVLVSVKIGSAVIYVEISSEEFRDMKLEAGRKINGYIKLRNLKACI